MYIKIHKKKHGIHASKTFVSFAHGRLGSKSGSKAWRDGWGLPEFHPIYKTSVAWFTDLRSKTRTTGGDYTSSAGCKQVLCEIMPQELKEKIAQLLNVPQAELEDAAPLDGDTEIQSSQSQVFPAFSQSQGAETVRVCKLKNCSFQTLSSGEMDMHLETHPRCVHCGKQFLTAETLTEHLVAHDTFTCDICHKDVECQGREQHIESHQRQELFKQTLDNGRIVRRPTPASAPKAKQSSGYRVFLKKNYTKLKEQNPHLSYKQVLGLVSVEWNGLGKVGQQAYKAIASAESTEAEPLLGHQQLQQQVQQLQQQLEGQVQAQRLQGGGQLSRIAQIPDQGRIFTCHICHALFGGALGLQDLNNHIEAQVIVLGLKKF